MLNQTEQSIIQEETDILERVLKALSEQNDGMNTRLILDRIDDLKRMINESSEGDLPTLVDSLNTQQSLLQSIGNNAKPNIENPYFAHLKLQSKNGLRDILIGHKTYLDVTNLPIVDWKVAPVSKVFFKFLQGDSYFYDIDDNEFDGKVLARRVLTIQNKKIARIDCPESILIFSNGEWKSHKQIQVFDMFQENQDASVNQSHKPSISALIDPEQYKVIHASKNQSLLITGSAGSGKTTVGTHRISNILADKDYMPNPKNLLMLVPGKGLQRLCEILLQRMSSPVPQISVLEDWVQKYAFSVLKGARRKIWYYASTQVLKVKRHPSMMLAIDKFIQLRTQELKAHVEQNLLRNQSDVDQIFEQEHLCYVDKIKKITEKTRAYNLNKPQEAKPIPQMAIDGFYSSYMKKTFELEEDRQEFFRNKEIHRFLIENSNGEITKSDIDALIKHCDQQFKERTKEQTANIEDGEQFDQYDLAGTMDYDDIPILLMILNAKTKGKAARYQNIKKYGHIFLDEAQSNSPQILNMIGFSKDTQATMTVAGDSAQQSSATTQFESWEKRLEYLHVKQKSAFTLQTIYRTTKEISDFSREVLGPSIKLPEVRTFKTGPKVIVQNERTDGHVASVLSEKLTKFGRQFPRSSMAIICKEEKTARAIYGVLKDLDIVRLVLDYDFSFSPGIEICLADQIKGLEFDFVVVPDCSHQTYSQAIYDRKLLHVVCTRAIHQLWLLSVVQPSKIIKNCRSYTTMN